MDQPRRLERTDSSIRNWTWGESNPQFPQCECGVIPLDHRPAYSSQLKSLVRLSPLKDFGYANGFKDLWRQAKALSHFSFVLDASCCGFATSVGFVSALQSPPVLQNGNAPQPMQRSIQLSYLEGCFRSTLKSVCQVFELWVGVSLEHSDIRVPQALRDYRIWNASGQHSRGDRMSVAVHFRVFLDLSLVSNPLPFGAERVTDLPCPAGGSREDKRVAWLPCLRPVKDLSNRFGDYQVARRTGSLGSFVLRHGNESGVHVDPDPFERNDFIGSNAGEPIEVEHIPEVFILTNRLGSLVFFRGYRAATLVRPERDSFEWVAVDLPHAGCGSERSTYSRGTALPRCAGLPRFLGNNPVFQMVRLRLADSQSPKVASECQLNSFLGFVSAWSKFVFSVLQVPVDYVGDGERVLAVSIASNSWRKGRAESVSTERLTLFVRATRRQRSRTGIGGMERRHRNAPFQTATAERSVTIRRARTADTVQARPVGIINTSYTSQKQAYVIVAGGHLDNRRGILAVFIFPLRNVLGLPSTHKRLSIISVPGDSLDSVAQGNGWTTGESKDLHDAARLHYVTHRPDARQQQVEGNVIDCRQRPSLAAKREVTLKLTIIPHPEDPDDVLITPVTTRKTPARNIEPVRARRTQKNQLQFTYHDEEPEETA